jgi:hypothetical protein
MGRKDALMAGLSMLGFLTPAWAAAPSDPVISISTESTIASQVIPSTSVVISSQPWRVVPNSAFTAGEKLSYVLKWGVLKGGHSTLEITGIEPVGTRKAFHIVSEASTTGLADLVYKTRDRNESWLDVESLTTLRYEKHIREGSYRVDESIELDQEKHTFSDKSHRLDKGTTQYVEGVIPLYALDVLSSLYYVRTLPLEEAKTYVVDVVDGKKVYPLVIHVQKKEKIKVPAGKFDCLRVEPQLRDPGIFLKKGKKLQVWLTDDAAHLPVLMRSEVAIGHVAAELYSTGLSSATVPDSPEK